MQVVVARHHDNKSTNWVGEVQGMWEVAELKKVLA